MKKPICLFPVFTVACVCNLSAAEPENLALKSAVSASSIEQAAFPPEKAIDGDRKTRWASKPGDREWIMLDFGEPKPVERIQLDWETAAGKEYVIQLSADGKQFTDAYRVTDGKPDAVEIITIKPQQARCVRMQGEKRATQFGYSLREFSVYSTTGNLALFRPVEASSTERKEFAPQLAVDGNPKTRWASAPKDDEFLTVDLEENRKVGRIVLNWERAAGKEYSIQFSPDGKHFSEVYRKLDGEPDAIETFLIKPQDTRFIRIQGIKRATQFGYSIRELEAYEE